MYCCFQETSAAMSFVPGSLAAMLCLPCYCMLLTSRSSRRPAICPLSFSTSARGRKLKSPLEVGSARALDLDPDVFRNCDHHTRWTSSVVVVVSLRGVYDRFDDDCDDPTGPNPVRKPVTSTATDICSTHNTPPTPHQCQKRRPLFPVSIRTQSKRIC